MLFESLYHMCIRHGIVGMMVIVEVVHVMNRDDL